MLVSQVSVCGMLFFVRHFQTGYSCIVLLFCVNSIVLLSLLLALFLYVYTCLTIFSSQYCGSPRAFKGCRIDKLSFREVYVRSLVQYIEQYIFISSFIYLFCLFVFSLLRMGIFASTFKEFTFAFIIPFIF